MYYRKAIFTPLPGLSLTSFAFSIQCLFDEQRHNVTTTQVIGGVPDPVRAAYLSALCWGQCGLKQRDSSGHPDGRNGESTEWHWHPDALDCSSLFGSLLQRCR